MNLAEARALITGGSSGIGRAIATGIIARGGSAVICARDKRRLEATAKEIGAHPIHADVSDERSVIALVRDTIQALGGYNVLINNAGFGAWAPLVETSSEEFRSVWETNVLGAMLVARESARHFVNERYGTIVNVSSTAGQRGFASGTAYVATKFALSGMTECWRAELRAHNVRVMQVNPSEVQTDFFGGKREPNPTKLRSEDIAHVVTSLLELEDRGFVTETTVWATNPK